MNALKNYVRINWKQIVLAGSAVVFMVALIFTQTGCSTIEGMAKDVSSMSAATRDAMTK